MRKSVFGVMCASLFAVQANSAIIDFEAGADGVGIGSDYIDQGIVFTDAYYASAYFLSENGSSVWVSGEADSSYNEIINISISGSFTGITDSVSAEIVWLDSSSTAYLDVFNINGDLLANVSTAATGSVEVLSISTPGISSFTFRWSSTKPDVDDVVGIDNLSFNTVTAVPIPAAVWLFGSGIICLIGIARRKKS
jgi:hypothetical protein